MSRFIESIRLQDGTIELLDEHQRRVNATFAAFYPEYQPLSLSRLLTDAALPEVGLFKVRVVYDATKAQLSYQPYTPRYPQTLRLVRADELRYDFKFADRRALDACFAQRAPADDILLVRHGYLTDSYYANTVFRKNGQWFTPLHPLLPGVRRARLLASGRIHTAAIRPEDLPHYERVSLINAMLPLGTVCLPVTHIF